MLPRSPQESPSAQRTETLRGNVGLIFVAALSALAGMTDAIGFLETGDFISFMSGNTTHLAVAVGEHLWAPVINITYWLIAFVIGNTVGVVVSRLAKRKAWPALLIIGFLLGLTSLLASDHHFFVLAVGAMGMINSVVEEVNGVPIGLTYVTGALSRFGRGLGRWFIGERRSGWRVQLVPWVGLLGGGIIGTVLQRNFAGTSLAFVSLFAVSLAVGSVLIPHRWQMQYMSE